MAMNGSPNDPHSHKRTSITELLNPVAASPVDPSSLPPHQVASIPHYANSSQYQQHQMVPQVPMHTQSSSGAFKLSAASWDQSNEDEQALQRKQQDPYAYTRGYPPGSTMPSPGMYPDHPSRPTRPRENSNSPFPVDAAWSGTGSGTGGEAPMPYSSPMVACSDERTAIRGNVTPPNPSPYPVPRSEPMNGYQPPDPMQYQPRPPAHPLSQPMQGVYAHPQGPIHAFYPDMVWQPNDRASIRPTARGPIDQSIPQMPMHAHPHLHHPPPPHANYAHGPPQHHPMYPPPGYYAPHPGMYGPMPYPPHMHGLLPMPSSKRPSIDGDTEEENGSKHKKARKSRAGADGAATNGSRRGYSAKKRNEAAQIAAQNAQLMPNVSYTSAGVDKGKQKAADGTMRIVNDDGPAASETQGPLHPELQFARCMSNRYKSETFPRCVSCTRRWAGDTCRFQGIRFFLKDDKGNIVGVSFVENQKPDAPSMNFPSRWNTALEPRYIKKTKRTIAKALLPTLRKELEHLDMPEVIRRPRESDVRATCDTCMTSIFSSSWMCRLCGREACAECFEKVRELTLYRPGANEAEMAALQAKRESHAHTNPFFLSCTRRNEHQSKDFSPMSRFCKAELAQVIEDMEALLAEPESEEVAAAQAKEAEGEQTPSDSPSRSETGETPNHGTSNGHSNGISNGAVNGHSAGNGSSTRSPDGLGATPSPAVVAPSNDSAHLGDHITGIVKDPDVPSYTAQSFADGELTDEIFVHVWSEGMPLVVTGLLPKFKVKWQPDYFIQKYPQQTCSLVECQTDANKRMNVAEFFKLFGQYEGRTECWKLKDWPSSSDFKSTFPDLYEDFSRFVPMPSYCRRDGALNIASHFPSNTVAPDLGPKMYNAMASNETVGTKGSTRLHMDMADAVNIMLHAEQQPDGSPGVAAWDLFRWEDADQLRKFLRKRFSNGSPASDPIHSQNIYLDSEMRKELYDSYGIKSYRVYQRPGDAVFIPAGCAHQVCNLADCIKVAIDFVSPENIDRCEKLTGEFRQQNQSMSWKEDVLQLRTMMWFAWLSCARQESAK